MPATKERTANPVLASRAFAALFRLDCILIPPSRLEDDVKGMVIHVRVSRTAKIRWVQPDAAVGLTRTWPTTRLYVPSRAPPILSP